MVKQYNLALIGTGAWGRNYLQAVKSVPDCQIKYLCSPHIDNHTDITGKFIRIRDYHKLINFNDIDGVIVAAPSSLHAEMAAFFIKNNVNVLVEKPVASSYQETLLLKKSHNNRFSIFMAGHIYLYDPLIMHIKSKIKEIGNLEYLVLENGKYDKKEEHTSALLDWGPHEISVAVEIVGKLPIFVSAWEHKKNNIDQLVVLNLKFAKNIHAFIKIGWIFPTKIRTRSFVGTNGAFEIREEEKDTKIVYTNFKNALRKNIVVKQKNTPLENEISDFIKSIKTKNNPRADIKQALAVMKIIDCAQKSIREHGKEVKIS